MTDVHDHRERAVARILDSSSQQKLVVGGPGTGKTHLFRLALEKAGGGIALTFINELVRDLEEKLGHLGSVRTLHAFSKRLLHQVDADGLSSSFAYYPPLLILIAEDLGVPKEDVEWVLHNVDSSSGLLAQVIELGNYYDCVSHTDLVYRMLNHFQRDMASIPSYPLIVVDEYQDFSLMETLLIAQLSRRSPVLIAGDDDQALYSFKYASPHLIRELASDPEVEVFPLEHCSRCTEVVVQAVRDVLDAATSQGYLEGRIAKDFVCFEPDKHEDSEAHPNISYVECSVERSDVPYMGRYVAEQIGAISEADIQESHAQGWPTVLVVGPGHFVRPVFEEIRTSFPQAVLRQGSELSVEILDGYRRLAVNSKSRLGWRIVLYCEPLQDEAEDMRSAIAGRVPFETALPNDYRDRQLDIRARRDPSDRQGILAWLEPISARLTSPRDLPRPERPPSLFAIPW